MPPRKLKQGSGWFCKDGNCTDVDIPRNVPILDDTTLHAFCVPKFFWK